MGSNAVRCVIIASVQLQSGCQSVSRRAGVPGNIDRVVLTQIKAVRRGVRYPCQTSRILSGTVLMSTGEIGYLVLILGALAVFSGVLAWQTWRNDKK